MDYFLSLGMEKNDCKGGICSESFLIKNDLSCVIGKKNCAEMNRCNSVKELHP